MIDHRLDEEVGIVYVTASGVLSIAMIDEHFATLGEMTRSLRNAGRPIRVLIDVRASPEPSPSMKDYIRRQIDRSFLRGDRIVLVTPDPAMKDDVRQVLSDYGVWSFCSKLAAEQWLLLGRRIEPDA